MRKYQGGLRSLHLTSLEIARCVRRASKRVSRDDGGSTTDLYQGVDLVLQELLAMLEAKGGFDKAAFFHEMNHVGGNV